MAGSARIANHRVVAVRLGDAVLVLERLTAGDRALHQRTDTLAIVGMHDAEVRGERAFEIERIDSVHAVELVAPLHRVGADVPQPSADVGQRLPLAKSLLDLGERCLREPCLGELLSDADRSGEVAPDSSRIGETDRRDRHRHAVLALESR